MKKLLTLVAIAASVAATGAYAHGDKPKHGGIVQSASNDISFELVNKDGKATIYVEDHGKPVATAGTSGKLTVLNGADKTEVPLEPTADNILVSKSNVALGAGAKAIASVTFADKKTTNVRFFIK
ncbi:hypothetical protein [Noviherbaspirillum autotrophicum]|uniref:Uncharacterized protein n=1 Tax=Noviherbaspirillum autotrophicum TaxID=709839 RepID=A0A0C1Y3C2_9BURK|nr:hypothetical protein [Noviherbaspirillum autotrophicum]KIF81598.1 hypothetical protein TSA66_13560 [Noviherbaspirillum autotrophicum]